METEHGCFEHTINPDWIDAPYHAETLQFVSAADMEAFLNGDSSCQDWLGWGDEAHLR